MIKRYRLILSGRVQDVGLRWRVSKYAQKYGLVGWVENQPNGMVRLEIEGERNILDNLVQWLKDSPAHIKIQTLTQEPIGLVGEKKFTIKYHNIWSRLFS